VKQSPVVDQVHGTPLLVAVGPDGKSFRVFVSRIDGKDTEFFLKQEPTPAKETDVPKKDVAKTEATKPQTEKTAKAALEPVSTPAVADAKAQPATGSVNVTPAVAGASQTSPKPTEQKPAAPVPTKPWILLDTATASEWNFQGCAISGPSQGKCLDRVPALKDYWFDWRNYHHDTSVYKH
jgi:hypothetical protein